jgi:hypothetical protein
MSSESLCSESDLRPSSTPASTRPRVTRQRRLAPSPPLAPTHFVLRPIPKFAPLVLGEHGPDLARRGIEIDPEWHPIVRSVTTALTYRSGRSTRRSSY